MKKRTIGAIAGVALLMVAVAPVAFAQDDLILYNQSAGGWLANYSTPSGFGPLPGDDSLAWGAATDKPLVGDVNGDGIQDVVLARSAPGGYSWFGGHGTDVGGISKFSAGGSGKAGWGAATGTPHLGDTNGDGIQDIIMIDNLNFLSFTSSSAGIGGGAANSFGGFGVAGDVPLLGDFNGDGATDLGVWRPSNGGTFIKPTVGGLFGSGASVSGSFQNAAWSFSTPLIGDINGDGRDDMLTTADVGGALFWRAAFGQADGSLDGSDISNQLNWGATASDIPMLADINGDGMDDIVIQRSGGTYFTRFTSAGGVLGGGASGTGLGWGNSSFTPIFADMTVIPEPAALGMLLVGGGILWVRKRLMI